MNFNESPRESQTEKQEKQEPKNIIENARKERLALSIDILKRLASHALDLTPLGNIKMGTEMVMGKTFSGETLNFRDRTMYSLIITNSLIFWGLLSHGISKRDPEALRLSGMFYAMTTGLTVAQKGIQIIRESQKLAKKYNMESLHQLLVTCEEIIIKLKENGNNGNK